MALTKEFMDAVQEEKLIRVRIMLKDSLLIDPTGAQFDEMEKYASGSMADLYTEHDGEPLSFDVGTWNEDYLNQQMVTVVNNFSKERIELLKGMVRYLYREKAKSIRAERNVSNASHKVTQKQIGAGVTAAGAVLAITGICTAHTVLAIGGAVAAVAGAALIISDKGKK